MGPQIHRLLIMFSQTTAVLIYFGGMSLSLSHTHTHTYTRNHDIVARRNNIIYNYGCMCVCESCAYLPLYPHKLVWLIPPYLRLHPMCINMIQNACFHISHICMYIYIYTYTHPHRHQHLPMNSARNKPRRQQIPSTQAAAVATVVGLKFGV